MDKGLDKNGASYFWSKVKGLFSPLSNRVTTVEEKTTDLTTDLDTLTSRVDTLYLKYHTDITGNSFNVSFKDLSGVTVTGGVYNQTEARIEF
jgi:hypothetical protein